MARVITPEGIIRINLPDDIAAGDTISGTVFTEPKGANEAEKTQNQSVLNGYVIDLGDGNKVTPGKPGFTWTPQILQTPAPSKYLIRIIEVIGRNGSPVSSINVPISTIVPAVPSNFTLPTLGQTGRPVTITGPFDGDASNTSCNVGGQPAPVLAESPRKTVVQSPAGVTGPTEIKVDEKGTQTSGLFRNVGVNLTAPKTNLTKGEKTSLTVQVIGLQGITGSIPLQIVTTGSVNMQGGNTQNIQIQPAQVMTGGNFTQTFGLTGTQAGGFNVIATVLVGNPTVSDNKCQCKCSFAKPPIISASKRVAEYSYTPNINTGCTGNNCTVQSISYVWSEGAGTTAKYAVHLGTDKTRKIVLDVTASGKLVLTVTVTVTCSDGTTCTATGTETFEVKK
jgi:hypothetical protein